ncbi:DUF4153 domain-containing protein [Lichenicola sp.]|uniref:DUF4153 domain-containing protein n=1 Tax=Lichenicola sp. TaxID=2804529 RepID=UPI003B00BF32
MKLTALSGETASRRNLVARACLGLAQGLLLYLLFEAARGHSWPATRPLLFGPLLTLVVALPVLASVSIGSLRGRTIACWLTIAAVMVAALSFHHGARQMSPPGAGVAAVGQTFGFGLLLTAALFMTQSLIMAGEADRRWRPGYPRLFETSWRLAIQLGLTFVFVGFFWAILWLGVALFALIGLHGFQRVITKPWFAEPTTWLAVAFSIHVTASRARLVDGARSLVLMLLSSLLPVLVAITTVFVVSLLFVSLHPLWGTRHAGLILSVAALLLVLLINGAYQDGLSNSDRPALILVAGRVGAILLVPIVALAIVALGLRVAQHGWSIERIYSAASLLVGALYAIGYAVAAVRPGRWLEILESVNVATSMVMVLLAVSLLSPVLDPTRLAVASQVARLRSGEAPAATFDYDFLRVHGLRYGLAALERLRDEPPAHDTDVIRDKARAEIALSRQGDPTGTPQAKPDAEDIRHNVTVHPAGRTLPSALLASLASPKSGSYGWIPPCLTVRTMSCDAVFLDLRHDGSQQLAFVGSVGGRVEIYEARPGGNWDVAGSFILPYDCPEIRTALLGGQVSTVPPVWPDIVIGGQQLGIERGSPPAACHQPGQ